MSVRIKINAQIKTSVQYFRT
ncbi:hypothetical protein KSF78_0008836 [Schistosoma japonicum]|nr:hypothetical protein KSF78_0008836 [Schistosoma japonicum]